MNKTALITLLLVALSLQADINFVINPENENYCVRYSPNSDEKCLAIGNLSGGDFMDLNKIAGGQLTEIDNCLAYTNDGHCEYCEMGFAYNGKSCERCTKSNLVQMNAASCDYNWRLQLRGRCGRVMGMRNGKAAYEDCLRRMRFPRMTSPLMRSNRRGRMWMWRWLNTRMGRWVPSRGMSGNCDSKRAPSTCNCFSSFDRNTCGKCNRGYTLQGFHVNENKWANKDTDGYKEFSGYHCVHNSSIGMSGCKVYSPADRFGGSELCAECDYENGFRMTSDYQCIDQEI